MSNQLPLFPAGDRTPAPKTLRERNPAVYACTAGVIGNGPTGETCGSCRFYVRVQNGDYFYPKCGLMRGAWTHGPGTDVKASWAACEKWEASK